MLDFLDSNVVIYVHSADDPIKALVAESLLLRPRRELVISAQVLTECASAFLHKAKRPRRTFSILSERCGIFARSKPTGFWSSAPFRPTPSTVCTSTTA